MAAAGHGKAVSRRGHQTYKGQNSSLLAFISVYNTSRFVSCLFRVHRHAKQSACFLVFVCLRDGVYVYVRCACVCVWLYVCVMMFMGGVHLFMCGM